MGSTGMANKALATRQKMQFRVEPFRPRKAGGTLPHQAGARQGAARIPAKFQAVGKPGPAKKE